MPQLLNRAGRLLFDNRHKILHAAAFLVAFLDTRERPAQPDRPRVKSPRKRR